MKPIKTKFDCAIAIGLIAFYWYLMGLLGLITSVVGISILAFIEPYKKVVT